MLEFKLRFNATFANNKIENISSSGSLIEISDVNEAKVAFKSRVFLSNMIIRNSFAESSIYKISLKEFSDTDSTYDNCSSNITFAFNTYIMLLDKLNIEDQNTETLF